MSRCHVDARCSSSKVKIGVRRSFSVSVKVSLPPCSSAYAPRLMPEMYSMMIYAVPFYKKQFLTDTTPTLLSNFATFCASRKKLLRPCRKDSSSFPANTLTVCCP